MDGNVQQLSRIFLCPGWTSVGKGFTFGLQNLFHRHAMVHALSLIRTKDYWPLHTYIHQPVEGPVFLKGHVHETWTVVSGNTKKKHVKTMNHISSSKCMCFSNWQAAPCGQFGRLGWIHFCSCSGFPILSLRGPSPAHQKLKENPKNKDPNWVCQATHGNCCHKDRDGNTLQNVNQGHFSEAGNTSAHGMESWRHGKRMPYVPRRSICCKTSHLDKAATCENKKFRLGEFDLETCTVYHVGKWVGACGLYRGNSPIGKALCVCRLGNGPCMSSHYHFHNRYSTFFFCLCRHQSPVTSQQSNIFWSPPPNKSTEALKQPWSDRPCNPVLVSLGPNTYLQLGSGQLCKCLNKEAWSPPCVQSAMGHMSGCQ